MVIFLFILFSLGYFKLLVEYVLTGLSCLDSKIFTICGTLILSVFEMALNNEQIF